MAIKNSDGIYLPGKDFSKLVPIWAFDADDFGLIDNGDDFDNWTVDAGSSVGAGGVTLVEDSSNDFARISISGLSPSTDYWIRVTITAVDGAAGNLVLRGQGEGNADIGEESAPTSPFTVGSAVGDYYVKVTTDAGSSPHVLEFIHDSGTDTNGITFEVSLWDHATPGGNSPVMVLGDRSGGYLESRADAADAIILDADLKTTEVISIGDVAQTATSYAAINDDLETALAGDIYPTAGNHDYDWTPISNAGNYLDYFSHILALSPATGDLRTYYSKVIGNIEYFFFDDNVENTDNGGMGSLAAVQASTMGQWLLNAIAASTARWKVVVIHHPPRSSSSAGGDYTNMAWDWGALGVCLVISGHKHTLEVQDWSDTDEGCIYGVIGMGGGNHHGWGTIDTETLWREESTTTEGCMRIIDDDNFLYVEMWTEGSVLAFRYCIEQITKI